MYMNKKIRLGDRVFDSINITFLILFCITIIYPFLRMITFSFSTEAEFMRSGLHLLPKSFFLGNWEKVIYSNLVWNAFFNTVFVVIAQCLYSLFISSTYAYSLSRKNLPDRNFWTLLLVITMFFSGGLIPTYLVYNKLGLVNSLWALVLGGLGGWNTLILRNFFMSIPDSIVESAKIDGASDVTIYSRLILPLSKPALATVALWVLVGSWNSWVGALIYITDMNKQVLQLVLRKLLFENIDIKKSIEDFGMAADIAASDKDLLVSTEALKAAMLLFVTFPILLTYPFLQKYFVKGIMVGSLKG